VDQRRVDWQSRAQFFGLAAQAMRRILVDHARARGRSKRGASAPRVALDAVEPAATEADVHPADAIDLDRALEKLETFDPGRAPVPRRERESRDGQSWGIPRRNPHRTPVGREDLGFWWCLVLAVPTRNSIGMGRASDGVRSASTTRGSQEGSRDVIDRRRCRLRSGHRVRS
jgi:hypothetical protein